MKVMVIVKATKSSEAGTPPSPELLAAMGKYNEDLVKAGVLLAPAVHAEPGHDADRVASALADELRSMAAWLELDRVEVGRRGDLASTLRRALKT